MGTNPKRTIERMNETPVTIRARSEASVMRIVMAREAEKRPPRPKRAARPARPAPIGLRMRAYVRLERTEALSLLAGGRGRAADEEEETFVRTVGGGGREGGGA